MKKMSFRLLGASVLSAFLVQATATSAQAQDSGWDWSHHTDQGQNPAPTPVPAPAPGQDQGQPQTGTPSQQAPQPQREWTMLVFMNGHNNLDSYTNYNLKQMEKVGSTDRVNIVVQWASSSAPKTRRLLVQKDTTNSSSVTSPIVQSLPTVDMGDYHELTNFIKWGAQNYPAKHYMVVVWNHGSGWHELANQTTNWNISFDDNSGHSIDTKQLGQSMADSAAAIGQKIDIYSSDACMMAMIEVAQEMSPSVSYFVGSEETEPMDGWPYDEFLQKWNNLTDMNPAAVAKIVPDAYVGSYSGGSQGTDNTATMAAWDLSKLPDTLTALTALKQEIVQGSDAVHKAAKSAVSSSQTFTYSDYVDAGDLLKNLDGSGTKLAAVANAKTALSKLVMVNATGSQFKNATGLAIWLPTSSYTYGEYSKLYQDLSFDKVTDWHDLIQTLVK